MPGIGTENLRNVILLSHSGAGKTSLCEALLYSTGAITRMGRIEDGNTVSDYEPEEVKRSASVQTSLIPCVVNGHKVNFLDTPGYDDFLGEVVSAIRAADAAVIAVAATAGTEVGTERAWALCESHNLPRIVFVNKMDRENADFSRTVDGLQKLFGRRCVPLNLPIGSQQSFKGVVDLLSSPDEAPAEVRAEANAARERLVEAVAEADDTLANKFLEGVELPREELLKGLRQGILKGAIVPVLAGSAVANLGVKELLDAVVHYLPSPKEARKAVAKGPGGAEVELKPDASAPLAAQVFKTTADPFVGRLSLFRVFQGTFKSDSQVWNANKEQAERVAQIFIMRGKNQETTPELVAGDIGAVAKLTVTGTGDTLCQKEQPLTLEPIQFPQASYAMAANPKTKSDVEKMSSALSRIVEEDPTLRAVRDPDTVEMLLWGLGESHLDVTVEKVRRKFGAELILQSPRVPYRETITAVSKAEYKHKKQSGGHGQYGHVLLRLEPRGRGEGFEFVEEVVGGSVPKEFIPAVEKGVNRSLGEGGLAGYPLVDLKVVLYDGSFHDVDSSGMSFEIAASHALRKGFTDARPVLLEPIMRVTITVPDSNTGEVIGDLNQKRGRILGMTPHSGLTEIEAEAPHAEILRYATELRSLTQGRGSYKAEYLRYEEVPAHITQRVVEEAKRAAAEKA